MALWDRVLSGFDLDDETVNFGTRIIAENNGLLYEACTMATIQSREQVLFVLFDGYMTTLTFRLMRCNIIVN